MGLIGVWFVGVILIRLLFIVAFVVLFGCCFAWLWLLVYCVVGCFIGWYWLIVLYLFCVYLICSELVYYCVLCIACFVCCLCCVCFVFALIMVCVVFVGLVCDVAFGWCCLDGVYC